MSEKRKKRFEKWEKQKRMQMGDSAFLDKYIVSFKFQDKFNKFIYILALIISLLLTIGRIIVLIKNPIFNNFFFMIVCFALTCTWIMLCGLYFQYLSDCCYWDHIERWKKEKEEIDKNQ